MGKISLNVKNKGMMTHVAGGVAGGVAEGVAEGFSPPIWKAKAFRYMRIWKAEAFPYAFPYTISGFSAGNPCGDCCCCACRCPSFRNSSLKLSSILWAKTVAKMEAKKGL